MKESEKKIKSFEERLAKEIKLYENSDQNMKSWLVKKTKARRKIVYQNLLERDREKAG